MRVEAETLAALSLSVLLCNVPSNRANRAFILSRGEAGPVKTGMTVDQLYATVGRDTTKLSDEHLEGFFAPVIQIYLPGGQGIRPSLIAEVVAGSAAFAVGRITVYDPRFKTSKGIGVGSTLGQIRRNYKVDWIGFGEGPLFARVQQLGMSFALDAKPPPKWYETHSPKLVSNNAKVVFIVLAV